MNPPNHPACTSLGAYEPDPDLLYSIEIVSHLAHVPRRLLAVYCRHRLIAPAMNPDCQGWYFNAQGVRALKRIEHLRNECGMNLTAIRMILDLAQEVDRLQEEIRRLQA